MENSYRKNKENFFSVAFDLIPQNLPLPFDLYVNASSREGKENFVRIYPIDEQLDSEDLAKFKAKYHQLYVSEEQRKKYLKTVIRIADCPDNEKAEVMKESAVKHLARVFNHANDLNTEVLEQAVEACRDSISAMVEVVRDYSIGQVRGLIADLSIHDFYTFDHSVNVSLYCIAILKNLNPNISNDELTTIGMGGLLHDLGKMEVPTSIINSSGKLTPEEFEVIKTHPGAGVRIAMEKLQNYPDQNELSVILRIIGEHHENVNGKGYPKGLSANEIHPYAKVCAVADFFDAITTKRSYCEVVSESEAIAIMEKTVGKKLDKDAFEALANDVGKVYGIKPCNRELDSDFEPSIPNNVLPFKKVTANKMNYDVFGSSAPKPDFGKIDIK